MSYQLKVMRDYPIGFWPLNEASGSVAYDISGAGNHGQYVGSFTHNLLPVIPIGGEGRLINFPYNYVTIEPLNDYTGEEGQPFFGTYGTSDNPFSIEFWISLDQVLENDTFRIIEDTGVQDERIIIDYDNGNILFGVYSSDNYTYYESKSYLPFHKKTIHVVATYSVNSISLFIDGMLMQTTSLPNNFKFNGTPISTQEPVILKMATTSKCIVNGLALYRYALPQQIIISHYIEGNTQISPYQVASKNDGKFFDLNAGKIYESFIYGYPADKELSSFIDSSNNNDIYYDQTNKSIQFYESSNSEIVLEDFVLIPQDIGTSSKIEWRGGPGVTVECSIDGINYEECANGRSIPQYTRGSYSESGILYIRINLLKSFNPKFSFLSIVFYRDKIIYSDNGGGKIYFPEVSNFPLTADIDLGTLNYPTLSRHFNNGIRCNKGFVIGTSSSSEIFLGIEMFFTPTSLNESTSLFGSFPFTPNVQYSWDSTGTISKTNISTIYVNNVDKSSETDVSNVFEVGQMHHVVIQFTEFIWGDIYFNHNPSTNLSGPDNLYNNIIIYTSPPDPLNPLGSQITRNYNLWTGNTSVILVDPAISIDEKTIKIDDVDWVVVQST